MTGPFQLIAKTALSKHPLQIHLSLQDPSLHTVNTICFNDLNKHSSRLQKTWRLLIPHKRQHIHANVPLVKARVSQWSVHLCRQSRENEVRLSRQSPSRVRPTTLGQIPLLPPTQENKRKMARNGNFFFCAKARLPELWWHHAVGNHYVKYSWEYFMRKIMHYIFLYCGQPEYFG